MKWAAIFLVVVLAFLIILAILKGDGALQAGMKASFTQGVKLLPILLIAFFIAGFVEVLLPKGFVERWLTDAAGWQGICIAWIAGILTPAGTIVGLPIAASLYKAGAGIGVLMTYLTSLALLSMIRLPLEVGIYGLKLTLIRIGVSILLPPVAGGIAILVASKFY
ncbi:MAG TPA: hypothetical protein DCE42_24995 [Myxococcales bacterium]|nr:hypothetical protein [Deltaproteobacteria bacterium]MBU47960.1 hypothetical protein [Deltaproteobacteria bacterium]HAA58043.1 hypothetical protein [Myxococcales bacterium]|tara:strand:+ start:15579 stop:16073 length:495 start_codon:yes stop_codon:yes gene_type:complete